MPIQGSCTICTDYFDLDSDISCTFCGHLFHSVCLNQWIKTCGTQRTCPQCRTRITSKQVVNKIFVNSPDENKQDLDPFLLKNKLDEADGKMKQMQSTNSELVSAIANLEDAKQEFKVSIKKLKNDLKSKEEAMRILTNKMVLMKNDMDEARHAEQEAKKLRNRLRLIEKVEIMLNGQKDQVSLMLEQYTNGSSPPEIKQLATCCVALKQEYESVKESKNKYNAELLKLRRELNKKDEALLSKVSMIESLERANSSYRKNEDALVNENQSLQKKLKALQNAIASPTDTKVSAVSRLLAESPAPEFLTPYEPKKPKRTVKDGGPIHMKVPRLSTSFEKDTIDLDEDADSLDNSAKGKNSLLDKPAKTLLKHDSKRGVSVVNTSSLTMAGSEKLKSDQHNSASLLRKQLVSNKSKLMSGYDRFGRRTKTSSLLPSRPPLVDKNSALKFSSVTSSEFKVISKKPSSNRFDRFKRLGPK